jgi:REP element-mobilizing transposase RayT
MDYFSKYLLRISKRLRRAKWWNYTNAGFYFITINTELKLHYFGEIKDGKMILTTSGIKVNEIWHLIPIQFPFIVLHEFVVMPNHIHGLIEIKKPNYLNLKMDVLEFNKNGGIAGLKNLMFTNNLSKVIRWFKGRTTFEIRKTNKYFYWSKNFHDIIVRDNISKIKISKYIQNNIKTWSQKGPEF